MSRLEHPLQLETAFVIKGAQRGFPLAGVWGIPQLQNPPRLGDIGG